MKRAITFLVFISAGLMLIAPGNVAAATISHSVSASLTGYTPVDPHEPIVVADPQMAHLFDVTFDDSNTSYDYYDIATDTIVTIDITDVKVYFPDAIFVSNASFTFTPEFLTVFSLLGINGLEGKTICLAYVAGMHNDSYPEDPMSFLYIFSFYNSGSDTTAISFRTDYRSTYSSWNTGYGMVYDHFSYDAEKGQFDWGNNAGYGEVQYVDITRTPSPAILQLLLTDE